MSTESLKKKIEELAKARGMGEDQAHVPVCEVCGKPANAPLPVITEQHFYPEDDPRRYPHGHHCEGCLALNREGWRQGVVSTILIRRSPACETRET